MAEAGITCIDCHMAKAVKTAEGDPSKYKGDIRSHLFKINTDPTKNLTCVSCHESDQERASGYLTLGWACLSCHQDKDLAWASSFYGVAHGGKGLEEEMETIKEELSSKEAKVSQLEERLFELSTTSEKMSMYKTTTYLLIVVVAILAIVSALGLKKK